MRHILKCVSCNEYTMSESCPKCGGKAVTVKPAKFSPEDRFADYRRKSKRERLEKKGWL